MKTIPDKNILDTLGEEIKCKISAISSEETFLEKGSPSKIDSLEELIDLVRCLVNIQRKIQDAIHSIQNLSIIAACSTLHYRLGPFNIQIPWNKFNKNQLLSSYLVELENTISKLIYFQDALVRSTYKDPVQDSFGTFSNPNLSNQSEWISYDSIKTALSNIKILAENNQDSINLLRCLILWDFDNGCTVGASDGEETCHEPTFDNIKTRRSSRAIRISMRQSLELKNNYSILPSQIIKHVKCKSSSRSIFSFILLIALISFISIFLTFGTEKYYTNSNNNDLLK